MRAGRVDAGFRSKEKFSGSNYFVQFRKKVGAGDTATSLAKPSSPIHGSRQCRHRDARTAAAS